MIYVTDSNADNEVVSFPEGSRVISTEVLDSVTGEQQTVIIIHPAPGSEVPRSAQETTLSSQAPG